MLENQSLEKLICEIKYLLIKIDPELPKELVKNLELEFDYRIHRLRLHLNAHINEKASSIIQEKAFLKRELHCLEDRYERLQKRYLQAESLNAILQSKNQDLKQQFQPRQIKLSKNDSIKLVQKENELLRYQLLTLHKNKQMSKTIEQKPKQSQLFDW